ncbi:MAG: hypothetical protein WD795_04570 [Woeseia sp.]
MALVAARRIRIPRPACPDSSGACSPLAAFSAPRATGSSDTAAALPAISVPIRVRKLRRELDLATRRVESSVMRSNQFMAGHQQGAGWHHPLVQHALPELQLLHAQLLTHRKSPQWQEIRRELRKSG